MKKKERSTLGTMALGELGKHQKDTETALAHLAIDRYTKQSKNSREGRTLRKKLAVIRTFMREKELVHGQET